MNEIEKTLEGYRWLQEQLLKKTKGVYEGYDAAREDLSPIEKALLRRLSDEQGRLRGIMAEFVKKFDEAKKQREQPRPQERR